MAAARGALARARQTEALAPGGEEPPGPHRGASMQWSEGQEGADPGSALQNCLGCVQALGQGACSPASIQALVLPCARRKVAGAGGGLFLLPGDQGSTHGPDSPARPRRRGSTWRAGKAPSASQVPLGSPGQSRAGAPPSSHIPSNASPALLRCHWDPESSQGSVRARCCPEGKCGMRHCVLRMPVHRDQLPRPALCPVWAQNLCTSP